MKGIIISLMKDILQVTDQDINNKSREKYQQLIWMHYDRINIKMIDDFSQYYISEGEEDEWVGNTYRLYLYSQESQFGYNSTDAEILIEDKENQAAFFCVATLKYQSFLRFNLEWNQTLDNGALIKEIRSKIKICFEQMPSDENKITYEIFSSLGSEDLVVIMLSNSMKKFLDAIEKIRQLKIEVNAKDESIFDITNSFVGQNKIKTEVQPDLSALVSVTLRPGIAASGFKEEIKQKLEKDGILIKEFKCSLGEYDVQFEISSSDKVLSLYEKDGILRGGKDFYINNIYQSRTMWLYDLSGSTDEKEDLAAAQSIGTIKGYEILDVNQINDKYKYINPAFAEKLVKLLEEVMSKMVLVKKTPHLQEIFKLLIIEYKHHISSIESNHWSIDLSLQFKAFIENLSYMVGLSRENPGYIELDNQMIILRRTVANLQQTFTHISQTNKLFLEVYGANLYYTGSYNHVLRAYYGVIRSLFSIGLLLPHETGAEQSKIAFTVNFDMTSKVQSTIYLLNNKNDGLRLVSFDLPYEALYNIPKYVFYLIHEVFHYIAPLSRRERNKQILGLWIDMLIVNIVDKFIPYICFDKDFARAEKKTEKEAQQIVDEEAVALITSFLKKRIESLGEDIANIFFEQRENNEIANSTLFVFVSEIEKLYFQDSSTKVSEKTNICDMVFRFIKEKVTDENSKIELIKAIAEERMRMMDNIVQLDTAVEEMFSRVSIKMESYELENIEIQSFIDYFFSSASYKAVNDSRQILFEGMVEAKCDMFMIQILDMSLINYLEMMIIFFEENMINLKSDVHSFSVRIGILVDSFYGKKEKEGNEHESIDKWFQNLLKEWECPKGVDKEFFKTLRDIIIEQHKNYLKGYGRYRKILNYYLKEVFLEDMRRKLEKGCEAPYFAEWNKKIAQIREYYVFYNNINQAGEDNKELRNNKKRYLYNLNIHMIEHFQKQTLLDDIPSIKIEKDETEWKPVNPTILKFRTAVSSLGRYLDEVNNMIGKLKYYATKSSRGLRGTTFWFRGVCNKQYKLLPSLLRNISEESCPYAFQAIQLKDLQSRTIQYPNFWMHDMPNIYDQISCLQHYGYSTNLLDFSLDALTALHFALNPDSEEKSQNEAVVYVLDPIAFRHAIEELEDKENDYNQYPLNIISESGYKDGCFDKYILRGMSDEIIAKKQSDWQEQDESEPKYPSPILFPQTNQRVLAQQGTFVAFDLMSKGKNKNYDYLCLKEIQKAYLLKSDRKNPFMQQVVISSAVIPELRDQLCTLGVTTEKMYPELDKIAKQSKERIKRLF